MRTSLIIIFSLIVVCQLTSQRSFGFYGDQYAGYEQIHANPALSQRSAHRWDLSLGGIHAFGYSDFAFIRKTSLLSLNSTVNDIQVIEAQSAIPETNDIPLLIFDEDRGRKIASFHGRLLGPAIRLNAGEFSIGVGMSVRGHVSSFDIPENLGTYELNESIQTEIINITEAQASFASWTETSLNISKSMGPSSFGISIKLNQTSGLSGYINNNANVNYDFVNDNISIPESGLDLNYAIDFAGIEEPSFSPFAGELSLGIDLGYFYSADQFSVGISILDLGTLHNSDIGVSVLSNTSGDFNINLDDYQAITDPTEFETQILNDLPIINSSEHLHVGLPTSLHIQGDWKYDENFHVSGSLFFRTPIYENSLKADNGIHIVPRYESEWISVFMPVTVYEFKKPRVGLAARLGFLTIGSEQLGSVLFQQDFRGSDIYMKLSFFPFWGESDRRSSKNSKLGCYEF